MDQYRIPLPDGRSLELSASQLQRLAKGLGADAASAADNGQAPPIIQALCTLPPEQRAEAIAVALLRFGEYQDLWTVAHHRHLSLTQVRQFEEAFRAALTRTPAPRLRVSSGIPIEMEEYAASRVVYG